MTQTLAEIVDALEALDIESLVEDPPQLAKAMIQRQEWIDLLQRGDFSAVPEAERVVLRGKIEHVLKRDVEVMAQLRAFSGELEKALGGLVSGRAAARGYLSADERGSSLVRRTG